MGDSARIGVGWSGGTYGTKYDTTFHRSDTGWYNFNVKNLVAKWTARTDSNYGMLLRDSIESGNTDGDQNRQYFRSSEYTGDSFFKPSLVVYYRVASDTFTFAIPTGRSVKHNDTNKIPVYVKGGGFTESKKVIAFGFSVVYMPELLKVVGYDTVGTLSSGCTIEWKDTVGICRVSEDKSTYISGSNDTLIFLKFSATDVAYADTNGTDLSVVEPSAGQEPIPKHPVMKNEDGNTLVTNLLYGDVNLNGTVSAADASYVLQYCAGIVNFGAMEFKAAEVSGDSCVTSYDAEIILKKLVGSIAHFPVGDTMFVQ